MTEQEIKKTIEKIRVLIRDNYEDVDDRVNEILLEEYKQGFRDAAQNNTDLIKKAKQAERKKWQNLAVEFGQDIINWRTKNKIADENMELEMILKKFRHKFELWVDLLKKLGGKK